MDPIADMIVIIKNAGASKKESVVLPYSKLKFAILESLAKDRFIKSVSKKGKKPIRFVEVELAYEDGKPRISGITRISKNSKRIYLKTSEVKKVKSGFGALVMSTSKGIMNDKSARSLKIGGEALFKIW